MSAAATTDPTLASLDAINDPSLYAVVRNVPVFKPHRQTKSRKDGSTYEVVVDAKRLKVIADNTRDLEVLAGLPKPLKPGHTLLSPLTPENQQPAPLGYARDARVGTFGPRKEPAILMDFYVRRDRLEEFKSYPYRSAEVYFADDEIRSVSLLRRDPALDLGILAYARDHREQTQYSMENTMPAMPDATNAAMPAANPTTPPDAAAPEPLDPGFKAQADQYMCENWGHLPKAPAAAPAAPADPAAPMPEKKEPPAPYARGVDPVQYAKLQRQSDDNAKALADLQANYAREQGENTFMRLENEGFVIPNKAKLLEKFIVATPAQRVDIETEIVTCYQRDITKGGFVRTVMPDTAGTDGDVTQDRELMEVTQYMRQTGEDDFNKAKKEYRAKVKAGK